MYQITSKFMKKYIYFNELIFLSHSESNLRIFSGLIIQLYKQYKFIKIINYIKYYIKLAMCMNDLFPSVFPSPV